jgi:periplasmic divalent cation tolerance protein
MGDATVAVVLTTIGSPEEAAALAGVLVERRLAACVQIVDGVRSLYRWKDRIEDDREVLLLVKIRSDAFETVRRAIREHHPYETPEIVLLPVRDGDPDYLRWVVQETRSADSA